jgi:hypothetical protein
MDGSKVIYTGWYAVPPEASYCATWIKDNVTGEMLNEVKECSGDRIEISSDDQFAVVTDLGFKLYAIPELESVIPDPTDGATGAGFLTQTAKAFYYYSTIDSLYIVDFSNAPSAITTVIPLEFNGTPFYPTGSAVDYKNHILYLISGNPNQGTYILVLNSDNLNVIQGQHEQWFYRRIAIHPDGDRIFLNGYGDYQDPGNRVDYYRVSMNTVGSFLSMEDIISGGQFQPRQIVFTPSGELMYVLIAGGALGPSPVIGVNIIDKTILQHIQPEHANANIIGISPLVHTH